MRWIKSLSLIFLVTLLLLIAGVSFTLYQKLQQAEITNLTWSLSHLDLNSVELESVSATYQQQQQIRLEKVQLHWTQMSSWFDSSFQITALTIKNAQLQLAPQTPIEDQASNIKMPAEFSWPKTSEEWQTNRFLSERLPWLALLPKTTEIKHFVLTRDCPQGLCSLTGQLSATIGDAEQTQPSAPLQANLQGSLSNPKFPENQLSFQLKAASTSENLPTLQLQLSLDKSLDLTLNNEIRVTDDLTDNLSSDGQLSTRLQLSGRAPDPIWFKTLEIWSGLSLSQAALLQLHQQALTPVKIALSNHMPLTSAALLFQPLTSQASKDENSQTAESSPLTQALERLSKLSTQFETNIELPKPTPIPEIGLLQGIFQTKLKLQQGVLEEYQLQASGTLLDHTLSEKLKETGLITGLKIEKISFELESQSNSQKNDLTKIPFDLTLSSVAPSTSKNQLHLVSQGDLSFGENPTLNLHKARFSLQQPALAIQAGSDQPRYDIRNLKVEMPFTAHYQNRSLTVKSPAAVIKGDLNVVDNANNSAPMAVLNDSSLNLKTLNFNLKKDPINTLINPHINALSWSLTSKQALLKTQFTSSQLKAKSLQVSLNSLHLSSPDNESKVNPLQIKTNYSASTPRLEQAQLLPQFWAANGALSGELNNLKFSGRISNAAGLRVQHNSHWKNKTLTTRWSLEPVYFLAGNPLKKSFSFWPEQLTLASGQLALKGQLKLNLKLVKDPLSALSGTVNADIKQVSGLYQQTAFSQISTLSALSFENKQFKVSLPNLQITQINHGLIAGPIQMTANYQGVLSTPLEGVVEIESLQSGLFNGQAWLDPQRIDLSNPFKTQLHLKNIEIAELLKQYPTSDLKGRGLVDGTLPLEINLTTQSQSQQPQAPRVLIQQGLVTSQASGGLLQYQPTTKSGIGKSNQTMQLVLDILDDFHYTLLQSRVDIGADQKLILGLTLKGQNPNVEKGRQVNLNINLEEDLPSLMTSMQITNQVSETIKRRVQEKLQQQSDSKK
ncbi:MAG: intermembrane phospholipid transport protein YdbH family protein [Pseudomonadota bacterium]